MKKCPFCKKEFEPENNIKIYCSQKCKDRHYYVHNAKKLRARTAKWRKDNPKKKKEYPKKECLICKKEFLPKSILNKYCSTKCRDRSYYLNHTKECKERSAKWAKDNPERARENHKRTNKIFLKKNKGYHHNYYINKIKKKKENKK